MNKFFSVTRTTAKLHISVLFVQLRADLMLTVLKGSLLRRSKGRERKHSTANARMQWASCAWVKSSALSFFLVLYRKGKLGLIVF